MRLLGRTAFISQAIFSWPPSMFQSNFTNKLIYLIIQKLPHQSWKICRALGPLGDASSFSNTCGNHQSAGDFPPLYCYFPKSPTWTHVQALQLCHGVAWSMVGFGQRHGQLGKPEQGFKRWFKGVPYLPVHLGITTASINIA